MYVVLVLRRVMGLSLLESIGAWLAGEHEHEHAVLLEGDPSRDTILSYRRHVL